MLDLLVDAIFDSGTKLSILNVIAELSAHTVLEMPALSPTMVTDLMILYSEKCSSCHWVS